MRSWLGRKRELEGRDRRDLAQDLALAQRHQFLGALADKGTAAIARPTTEAVPNLAADALPSAG